MGSLMAGVDRSTRAFWKWRGRRVDIEGGQSWLSTVRSAGSEVGP